jgi:hypothetical protein
VFRRAAHEIRVVGGLGLVLLAFAAGYYELHQVRRQADRDFALCGGVQQAPDCVSRQRPVSVSWIQSSNNGFRREYQVAAQTSSHITVSLGSLSKEDVAPFEGVQTAELRYRQGRLVAFVAPDGASLEVPFDFNMHLLVVFGSAIVVGLLGAGSMAWGFTRVNRTPRT